ncbi:phospholipase D delta [Selaginella moellendorffii]|nr:phospholipase D delta [Selaginella moellendorffii]|eukprot:XP_002988389.2 phospholipase D delta [Selaginella moellendorffii]
MGDQIRDDDGKPLGWSIPAHPDEGDGAINSRAVRFKDAGTSDGEFEVKHENVEQHHQEQQRPPAGGGDHFPSFPSSDLGKMEDVSLGASSPKVCLLYGTVELEIIEAKSLPNMDWFSERASQCFSILGGLQTMCAKPKDKLAHHRHKITSDPYVVFSLGDAILAKTKVISNSQIPHWGERFQLHVAHSVPEVLLTVKDNDVFGAQVIGGVKIPAHRIASGPAIVETWFDVVGSGKEGAQLKISIKYTPVEQDKNYQHGVGAEGAVPRTYFPLRKGCSVKLYQDAHCPDGGLPEITLEGGGAYEHGKCWEDICQAILEAHHLVYIAGWSVFHKVKIVREPENHKKFSNDIANLTLGELLKRKAAEGVRVLLLVWDDKTSHHTPLFTTKGVMATYDEETKKFFRHSAVRCVLSPRYGDSKMSWLKQWVVGTFYTHHQKLVIVDSQGRGNNRKLTSFIGGLDLAQGRYDTPEHPLFKTLGSIHRDDYHNPTFTGTIDHGGPRQPWHDLHCRIDGPAAYDVLTNFAQRWRKAATWHEDAMIEIDRISWILSPNDGDQALMVTELDDPETWNVQVFRSIDSGSVKGFPKEPADCQKQNLVTLKNVAIDTSIHTAYVERIRSAQHFIYIENQYFLGSSYAWPDYKKGDATHMIPMELALKVASKIRSGDPFAVYVVIPMWPEGVPDSATVQEILYFQSQTMKMMYKIIAQALNEVGSGNHPTDYLNFYCLANREERSEPGTMAPAEKSTQWYAQKYKRFMIYIHSKGMIVDDEYVIIGSANINQRSMDGSRDTELAMGAYQPHYTWAHKKHSHPFGQVYGYRASLWAEHLGDFDPALFNDPSDIRCVHKVNEIAQGNWKQFVSEEPSDMKGHLMSYPMSVQVNGEIKPIAGNESFPDVAGQVLGQHSINLPDNLTG